MLGGTEKGGPKGQGWQYQAKQTRGQRRGHCSAGKIPLVVSCLFTSDFQACECTVPTPSLGHLTCHRLVTLRVSDEIHFSSGSCPSLPQRLYGPLRGSQSTLHLPYLSLPCYVIITALVPCPSHPLEYKPLRAGSVWLV